ncbi:MAG: hypothetical protein MMC23_010047 [Stictis urceolatum]|nr:hypothetical protein [Stictis urceolata]
MLLPFDNSSHSGAQAASTQSPACKPTQRQELIGSTETVTSSKNAGAYIEPKVKFVGVNIVISPVTSPGRPRDHPDIEYVAAVPDPIEGSLTKNTDGKDQVQGLESNIASYFERDITFVQRVFRSMRGIGSWLSACLGRGRKAVKDDGVLCEG